MAIEPIVINEFSSPIDNTRKQFIEEELKARGKTGYKFYKYKTEKERIADHFKNLKTINTKYNIGFLGGERIIVKKEDDKNEKKPFLQPSMRFRPRNDYERIFETAQQHHPELDRKVLDNYMKKLTDRKNQSKNNLETQPAEETDIGEKEIKLKTTHFKRKSSVINPRSDLINIYDIKQDLKELEREQKNIQENQPKKKFNYSTNLNQLIRKKEMQAAKILFKELYHKTHFKGALNIALKSIIYIVNLR